MVRIVLIGITALFLAMLAGSIKKEYGIVIAVVAALLIFSFGVEKISYMMEQVKLFEKAVGVDSAYVTILLKMVGIAYLSQFAVSLCKDAGHGAIAGQIGFAGKLSMLVVSIPVLEALVKNIGEFFS